MKRHRIRTAEEVREAFRDSGISITQWAISNGFSPNLVFEVLSGRKKAIRGQAHQIAVKLGLKEGHIVKDPSKALDPKKHK